MVQSLLDWKPLGSTLYQTTMAKKQPRVYEYTTPEGVMLWSFTRFPSHVTHSQKLVLDSPEGSPLSQYLADLRGLGRVLGIPDKEKP